MAACERYFERQKKRPSRSDLCQTMGKAASNKILFITRGARSMQIESVGFHEEPLDSHVQCTQCVCKDELIN